MKLKNMNLKNINNLANLICTNYLSAKWRMTSLSFGELDYFLQFTS